MKSIYYLPPQKASPFIQKCYLEYRILMTFINLKDFNPPFPTCSFYHTFCTSSAKAVNQKQFSSYLEEIVSGKSGDDRADISCLILSAKCAGSITFNGESSYPLKFNFKGPVYCTMDMSVPYLVRYLPRWNCRWTKFPDADIFGISPFWEQSSL